MATGMFDTPNPVRVRAGRRGRIAQVERYSAGGCKAAVLARKKRAAENLDRFAALLCDPEIDGNVSQVARCMGISQQRGAQLMAKLRKRLGWQAR